MNAGGETAGRFDWRWIPLVALWLVVFGKIALTLGGWGAEWWQHDLRTLWRDQTLFSAGTYPHAAVTPAAGEVRTAYPPTSFPLFAPWLPPGLGWRAARVWFAGCQLAALGALAWFAWRRGRAVDARLGWLLMGAVLAMSGVRADMLFGNIALIATALLLGALLAFERGRAGGAAVAWLAAMVKPQIGWLFALAWWRRGAWRAWTGAAAALAASGIAACVWTGASLAQTLGVEAGEETAKWAAWSPLTNLPVLLGAAGLSPHAALVAGALAGVGFAAWAATRPAVRGDWLAQFAILGLVNRACTYHNYCDDVLLTFALVWLGRRAWAGGWRERAVWLALGATAWLPTRAIAATEAKALVVLLWLAAAWWIARRPGEAQRVAA